MDLLGLTGLIIFFGVIVASLRGWIRQDILPIQSALILSSIVLVVLAFMSGNSVGVRELMSNLYLHPITALIAGFLVAGALEAAGAFRAAIHLLERASRTPVGMTGTVALLVNTPTILAMPCGRIMAAALIPAAILFGHNIAKAKKSPLLASIIVFGFIVNAAASCGPSPIGGIGMVGEGMGGYELGSFGNAQQIAIMLITAVTMLSTRFIYRIMPSESLLNVEEEAEEKKEKTEKIPRSGYLALGIFLLTITSVFVLKPPVPIQTVLMLIVLVVMVISETSIQDLVAGVILHPVMAMISGFIMAGALVAVGSFDVLIELLENVALTPLGYVGVAVLLVNLPTILPMPCGRIIGMALIPGVLMFGTRLGDVTGSAFAVPIVLTAFIVNAAASCGPSPIGGIGGIGEGNLGTAIGVSGRPQQVGILVGTGFAALTISLLGFI
ncbi:MAG: hypothetical protein GF416_03045 [Candidatus Altiarchaeales archaeon]|nr:hypothetical protein [Candidatus Altiarchaeales archaeon]MBD3416097.1 hypothetical protein [Candidatus Altiarchaeales archaeon]